MRLVPAVLGVMSTVFGLGTAGSANAQNAEAGQRAFVVCRACHQIGPTAKNAIGPALNGIVGRKAGTYPGYEYSPANRDSGITWSEATLASYLEKPQSVVPGTKMIFLGLSDRQKVADVIGFLSQYDADGQKVK